jgi:SAM-dependent methyltransferase
MDQKSHYIICGGEEGAKRLHVLSRAMKPASMSLLGRAGLVPGFEVLDAGCGSGDVTLEIARITGSDGRVVGIDMDESILHFARSASDICGFPVEWRCSCVEELEEERSFDMVYARFLLSHLPDPAGTLRRMLKAVRPGGRVVIEDIDIGTHVYWPINTSFQRYIDLYVEAGRKKGVDPDIGPRLPGLMVDAGFEDIDVSISMPVFLSGEGKSIARLTLADIADTVIELGLCNRSEIDQLLSELHAYETDPKSIQSTAQVFQVIGHRSGRG